MALNFSHRPIFASHLTEDNLVSPMRIANGYSVDGERSGDAFARNWHLNREMDDYFEYGKDRTDSRCGSQESVSTDILDLLPSDPFGMDISTTFTAAITGWLEDLEVDYAGYGADEVGTADMNCQLFAGLNFFWNNAMRFQAIPENRGFDNWLNMASGSGGNVGVSNERNEVLQQAETISDREEESPHAALSYALFGVGNDRNDVLQQADTSSGTEEESPHAALSYALSYLGVRDLLTVEMVCRSLCSWVRSDSLLWRNIHIDQPLNERITDDILLEVTKRAQGKLQCLNLVDCARITDDGLKRVLESNPMITKLCVPGCTRLSIDGIVSSLKALKSAGVEGVKHLRITGVHGVTQEHYEELKLLLGADNSKQQAFHRPHFYYRGNFYLSWEDDSTIDIEMCPRCQNLKLVYDCPAEGCQAKGDLSHICRACILCIARCIQCGRCLNDSEYEETFCLELLCSQCLKQPMNPQEVQDRKNGHPTSVVIREPSSHT